MGLEPRREINTLYLYLYLYSPRDQSGEQPDWRPRGLYLYLYLYLINTFILFNLIKFHFI